MRCLGRYKAGRSIRDDILAPAACPLFARTSQLAKGLLWYSMEPNKQSSPGLAAEG